MKLKKIFQNISQAKFFGKKDLEITGVSSCSNLVSPGNLFVVKKGMASDGHQYVDQAIASGAIACVTDLYDPTLSITQVVLEDVNRFEGEIAAAYYQDPSHELFSVGITGTNGKTTTSFILKHLLDAFFGPAGLTGTIEYIIGRHRYKPTHTTLDACSNHKLLREMVLQGCRASVMEVSSHALAQNRVAGVDYDVTIFTNLSQDHLDYHHTMEAYALEKQKLFRQQASKPCGQKTHRRCAIIHANAAYADLMKQGCALDVITYGIEGPYDVVASNIRCSPTRTECLVTTKTETSKLVLPLIGRFNVENALAAIATLVSQGFALQKVCQKLKTLRAIRGRLESVPNPLGFHVFVDFAHTPDALEKVLQALQELPHQKILTVFGCGGMRDEGKRPKMAQVVERFSDLAIVTTDNCRQERPEQILTQIMRGFSSPESFLIEPDRQSAIAKALTLAQEGDLVLIAGKGHETTQLLYDQALEFDDREVARKLCESLS